jgi:hypothetical protein
MTGRTIQAGRQQRMREEDAVFGRGLGPLLKGLLSRLGRDPLLLVLELLEARGAAWGSYAPIASASS